MAILLPAPGTPTASGSDCVSCGAIRQVLTQCGSCGQQPNTCAPGEHPLPCLRGETIDPNTGCCMPSGGPQPYNCPPGDIKIINGQCPPNYHPDPNSQGCCAPGANPPLLPPPQPACPQGDTPLPCGEGYEPDPNSPSCCKPMEVQACFVCPGGLPELALALQGQPNDCYLQSQTFLPGPAFIPGGGSVPAGL